MAISRWPEKHLRCTKNIRNLYGMPNNNDKTEYSREQLLDFASRIHACAAEFEKTAAEMEKLNHLWSRLTMLRQIFAIIFGLLIYVAWLYLRERFRYG